MKELNFSFLLTVFKKHWWKIVAITLLVMILAAAVTQFLIPKKYSSSVKFYVVNVNTDLDYTSATYLAAAEYLVNDYIEIIQGDTLLTKISDVLQSEGYSNVTPNTLRGMLKSSSKTETSVFTVTVSHTDKKLAYRTAQLLEEIAPTTVTEIAKPIDNTGAIIADRTHSVLQAMQKDGAFPEGYNVPKLEQIKTFLELNGEPTTRLDCIAVLKSPVEAKTHDSPNLIVNTLLSGVIAAVLSYGFFLILSSIASTLVTEDDVKNMIGKPVISAIPHWETTAKK
ncbi:MAG: hypothetical protein IJD64_01370 [Clostridia bacterium]|nr:hypothetical protein [Clostridia bacterium]